MCEGRFGWRGFELTGWAVCNIHRQQKLFETEEIIAVRVKDPQYVVDKVFSVPCNKMVSTSMEWIKVTLWIEGLHQVPQLGPGQFAIRAFIPERNCFQCETEIRPEFAEPLEYFFFRKVGVLEAKVKVCRSQVEGGGKKVTLQLRKILIHIGISSPIYVVRWTSHIFHRVSWVKNELLRQFAKPKLFFWETKLLQFLPHRSSVTNIQDSPSIMHNSQSFMAIIMNNP